jgi:hypothetical protein
MTTTNITVIKTGVQHHTAVCAYAEDTGYSFEESDIIILTIWSLDLIAHFVVRATFTALSFLLATKVQIKRDTELSKNTLDVKFIQANIRIINFVV